MERLTSAISALRTGLEALSPEAQPAEWAAGQNRLGGLLSQAAGYLGGAARSQILREAVLAYQAALEGIDRKKAIQEWSIVSYNLGSAQLELGESLAGDDAAEALREAAATLEPLAAQLPPGAGMMRAAVLSHHGDALLELGLGMPAEEGRLRIEKALQPLRRQRPKRAAGGCRGGPARHDGLRPGPRRRRAGFPPAGGPAAATFARARRSPPTKKRPKPSAASTIRSFSCRSSRSWASSACRRRWPCPGPPR